MAKSIQQTAVKRGLLPLFLTIGGFFLFVVILGLFWTNQRPSAVAWGGRTPEQRLETLREQRVREAEELNNYGWADREQGVVRLPVERAMELVLQELNGGEGTSN
jgi:hypothetical protein